MKKPPTYSKSSSAILLAAIAACGFATAASAQTRTWTTTTPTGDTGVWSDASKWSGANVPDSSGENATFGAYANDRTITVDSSVYTINALTITPRTSGFVAKAFTLNSSGGGSLAIGAGGVSIDNGGTVAISVGIDVTANQTWTGLTSNPSGNANFTGNISGIGQITRTASNVSTFTFSGANTFSGGFVNSAQITRIGSNSVLGTSITSSALGTGNVTLNGGTLSSGSATARTVYNNVLIGGNVTLGQASGGTGALTFATDSGFTTATTFNLNSASNGTVRTLTTAVSTTISKGVGESGGGTGLGLTKAGTSTLTLSGDNTYTGNTTVSAGTFTLTSTSSQLFKVTDSGSTQFLGTGTVNFNGAIKLDLSSITNFTNSWTLVDVTNLTETFNATTFSVLDNAGSLSFVETANVWNATSGGVTYSFAESTGILTVVPEPGTAGMILCGFGLLLAFQRKRRMSGV